MKTSQQIYQLTKNKTRVVILGSERKTIVAMILHVLTYHERKVDIILESTQKVLLNDDNDFVVIEAGENAHELKANIVLINSSSNLDKTQLTAIINSITNGGILVYNETDVLLKFLILSSTHTVQKYPYQTPTHTIENDSIYLDTNEGKLPLEMSEKNLQHVLGVKWICQHMAIDEDDFYEAVGSYKG